MLNVLQNISNLDQNNLHASVRRWAPPTSFPKHFLLLFCWLFTSKSDVRIYSFLSHCRIPVWQGVNEVIVGALLECSARLSVDCVLTPTLLCAVTNQFCALVFYHCVCHMGRTSAANPYKNLVCRKYWNLPRAQSCLGPALARDDRLSFASPNIHPCS